MQVVSEETGQLLRLQGRLDVTTVADIRTVLHEAVDLGADDLVVDLSDVELVDATGLGVLVGVHRRASRLGRRLVLRGVPPRVLRLLAVTRLSRILAIEPSVPAIA
jgi:anti-anti-sigma factor